MFCVISYYSLVCAQGASRSAVQFTIFFQYNLVFSLLYPSLSADLLFYPGSCCEAQNAFLVLCPGSSWPLPVRFIFPHLSFKLLITVHTSLLFFLLMSPSVSFDCLLFFFLIISILLLLSYPSIVCLHFLFFSALLLITFRSVLCLLIPFHSHVCFYCTVLDTMSRELPACHKEQKK
jgi:hypothetical protein